MIPPVCLTLSDDAISGDVNRKWLLIGWISSSLVLTYTNI